MSSTRRHRRNFNRPWFSPANAEHTHFMKIILPPTIHAQNMKIPNEFVRRFKNELSASEATIFVPDGGVWKMEMKKSEHRVWFCKGWEEFVKHYSLSFGFFLVFNYEGNSQFRVMIFDSSLAEIHYPCKVNTQKQASVATKCHRKRTSNFDNCGSKSRSQKKPKLEDEEEIIDIEDEEEVVDIEEEVEIIDIEGEKEIIDIEDESALEDGTSGKCDRTEQEEINSQRKHEKEKDRPAQGLCFSKRALSEKKGNMEAAQDFKSGNENIIFTTRIKIVNLNCCYLAVPASSARCGGTYMRKVGCVTLQDCNGKRWLVNYRKTASSSTRVRLLGGWTAFARANNLKKGDVCVFELIQKKDHVFKVSIFRTCHSSGRGLCSKTREETQSTRHIVMEATQDFKSENENVSFTTTIKLANLNSWYLDVPASSAKAYMRNVDFVTLHDSNGERWLVNCRRSASNSSRVQMLGGWIAFARANNLKEGDICVFELIQKKDHVFKVSIFRTYHSSGRGLCSKTREGALSKRHIDMEAAQNSRPENRPSFTATIMPPNLKYRYMDVPTSFWRKYMGTRRPMKLEDSKGRKWEVNYYKLGSSIRILKGWISFARANNVKEGDKCVFELIKWKKKYVFKITMFAC